MERKYWVWFFDILIGIFSSWNFLHSISFSLSLYLDYILSSCFSLFFLSSFSSSRTLSISFWFFPSWRKKKIFKRCKFLWESHELLLMTFFLSHFLSFSFPEFSYMRVRERKMREREKRVTSCCCQQFNEFITADSTTTDLT